MLAMTPGEKIRQRRDALGLSQADLGREVGCSQATIEKIEKGETVRSKFLSLLAVRLDLPLGEIDPGYAAIEKPASTLEIPGDKLVGSSRDFRVYASAEGGPGEIIRSSDPIDFVPRPAPVQHVKEAYGLIVTGDSMEPEFRPGDTLILNPRLPVIGGESYVFYAEVAGEARATIKNLRRATVDKWMVRQWNPPKEFSLSRKEWRICHRVLGKYSRQ